MGTNKKTKKNKKLERTPIVAMLGHVDHGKTTILDQLRKTSVQEGEEGGITQSISTSTFNYEGGDITFVDTPGHQAFDLMRMRGGEVADIILLVVAANDSVKPQTKESIEIIKKTGTPCIVVINKVDLKGIDIEKVKRDLANEGILVESVGGEVPAVEISAKTGEGMESLLEMIQLVSEINEIESVQPEDYQGKAFVLECIKEECRGNVSTIVVTEGRFSKGEFICYPSEGEIISDKIKGFVSAKGETKSEVDQGYGAQIIGLSEVVDLGGRVFCVSDPNDVEEDWFTKKVETQVEEKEEVSDEDEEVADEEILSALLSGDDEDGDTVKSLNVLVRAGSKGALDAVIKSLKELKDDLDGLEIVDSKVGTITATDVDYASDMKAIALGFDVEIDKSVKDLAEKKRVLVREYNLIYNLINEVQDAAEALQEPDEYEEEVGEARIKQIFELSDGTQVLGMKVEEGELKHGLKCRIIRDGEILCEGEITSMRIEKEKVDRVGKGQECGAIIDAKCEPQAGDHFECFRIVKA